MPPFLRNMWTDLREKMLWPVAVALVLILVAIPVFLGGGNSSAPAPAPKPASGAPTAAVAAVATQPGANGVVVVGDTTPQRRRRGGNLRNPFVQPKVAAPKSQTTTPSTGSAGTPAPTPGISGSGGSPVPTPTNPGTGNGGSNGSSDKNGIDPLDVYRVDLRFGQAGRLRKIADIPRLTPLPSKNDPFFVFLGVLKDGKTAVFLVSSDAVATGDGRCRPSRRNCQTIELQGGDTQFFDLVTPGGDSLQFQMDLKSIRKVSVPAADARAAYALHSRDGAQVARAASDQVETQQVRAYHYRPADGVLVRAKAAPARTAAIGTSLRRFEFQPGEVDVFRSRPGR